MVITIIIAFSSRGDPMLSVMESCLWWISLLSESLGEEWPILIGLSEKQCTGIHSEVRSSPAPERPFAVALSDESSKKCLKVIGLNGWQTARSAWKNRVQGTTTCSLAHREKHWSWDMSSPHNVLYSGRKAWHHHRQINCKGTGLASPRDYLFSPAKEN